MTDLVDKDHSVESTIKRTLLGVGMMKSARCFARWNAKNEPSIESDNGGKPSPFKLLERMTGGCICQCASFEDSNRTVELFNLQLTMADQKNDDA